ncbi:hypothetical protein CWI53_06440 [Neisseria meningitidis]|nr:hypothetical protein CWI53_06440 [Neisseria meningitidis]
MLPLFVQPDLAGSNNAVDMPFGNPLENCNKILIKTFTPLMFGTPYKPNQIFAYFERFQL